jgi:hypothetical protein
MKRTISLVAAAACSWLLISCAPDVTSVQIMNAIPGPDPECVVSSDTTNQKSGGSINIGYSDSYFLALWVRNALDNTEVQAGGTTVQPETRNDFYLREVVLNYAGKHVPSIPEQVRPTAGRVPAGGDLFLSAGLLTDDVVTRLHPAPIPPDGLNVVVEIRFRGEFAHGASYETEPFFFPLRVWNTEPLQCDWTKEMPIADPATEAMPACGNWSQDGVYYVCGERERRN